MGFRSDGGSLWMNFGAGTGTIYATDGVGGSTATRTSSLWLTAASATGSTSNPNALVDGILVTTADGAGSTLTVFLADAGVTTVIAIPIAAAQACPLYIPLGGPNGLGVPDGFAFSTSSTNTKGQIYFRTLP